MSEQKTQTTLEDLRTIIQRLSDSRIDTVGHASKPQSLVETFWLDQLEKKFTDYLVERKARINLASERG